MNSGSVTDRQKDPHEQLPEVDLIEVLLTLSPSQYAEMGANLARLRERLDIGTSVSNTELILDLVRPFYTIATLAERLQLGERTIRNYVESGEIPSYKFGRARRIDPEDVDRFLASRRT